MYSTISKVMADSKQIIARLSKSEKCRAEVAKWLVSKDYAGQYTKCRAKLSPECLGVEESHKVLAKRCTKCHKVYKHQLYERSKC